MWCGYVGDGDFGFPVGDEEYACPFAGPVVFFVEVAFDLFHVVEFVLGAFACFFDALADVVDRFVDDVAVGLVEFVVGVRVEVLVAFLQVWCGIHVYAAVVFVFVELLLECFDVFVGGVECVACFLEFFFEFFALCDCVSEVLLV